MKNRSLLKLFFVNFVIFLTGMGLLPLLPLYATQFGATAADVGLYMAITYASITTGTMLTGRLAGRLGHRGLFIGAGVLGVPALFLLGQATAFWQVIVLTGTVWFAGGIGVALVNVLTSLYAKQNGRGKAFSQTFLPLPLASLVAGFVIGPLAEWQGYPIVFSILGLAWAGWPIVAIVGWDRPPTPEPSETPSSGGRGWRGFGSAFYFLLVATLLSATTVYLMRLGTSLSMQSLNFSPTAIASTSAVGGLVMIPVTYAIGTMSDRLGRKRFLTLGYLLGAAGALVMGSAGQLWQFWLATAMVFVALSANGAVAPALATDLLTPEARKRGLPYLTSMKNLAGIIGFAAGGTVIDSAGHYSLYIIAAALALAAVLLLGQVSRKSHPESQEPAAQAGHNLQLAPERAR